jgi:hypothetical protein
MLRFGMTYALTMSDIKEVVGITEEQMSGIESRVAEKVHPPDDVLYRQMACSEWIETVKLSHLDAHEAFVFCYRFGRWQGDSVTLDVIGKTLDLTRERVRQIEKKALLALQQRVKIEGIQIERRVMLRGA